MLVDILIKEKKNCIEFLMARVIVPDPTRRSNPIQDAVLNSNPIPFSLSVKHISNAHFVKDIYLYENIFVYTNST